MQHVVSYNIEKLLEEILYGETFLNIARNLGNSAMQNTGQTDNSKNDECFYIELRECLLNLPPLETMENPITIANIVNHDKFTNLPLQQKIMSDPDMFRHEELENYEVIHQKQLRQDLEDCNTKHAPAATHNMVPICIRSLSTTATLRRH